MCGVRWSGSTGLFTWFALPAWHPAIPPPVVRCRGGRDTVMVVVMGQPRVAAVGGSRGGSRGW